MNKHLPFLFLLAAVAAGMMSCHKDQSVATASTSTAAIQNAAASLQAIAVGTVSASSTTAADSIYVVNTCAHNAHRDSIGFSSLPASIATYLSASYTGYAAQKAFTIKDNSGILQGYVVIIQYNGKPVGLKFDASGNFLQVLEQREGRDLTGPGWHSGGHFDDRDGRERDTMALSGLPASILNYYTANYPQDTLVKAFKEQDNSYVVISKNNGAYATVFASTGSFVKRTSIESHEGRISAIAQASLPASVSAYLTATYAGYTFKQAFSFTQNGALRGYLVFLDASNTKYAVEFDASGNFVRAVTVH